MKRARSLLLALLLAVPLMAQQVNQDYIPASGGLNIGHSDMRWNGFFQNLDMSGTCTYRGKACATVFATGIPTYSGVVALWAGGSCSGFLKSDGTCTTSTGGLADPGSNGVVTRTALNTTGVAAYTDLVALWAGGACSGALQSGGTCVAQVPTSTTVNGHALSGNVTVTNSDLGAVPTSTTVNGHALSANVTVSASDLTTGTLPCGQLPALTGGVTTSAGSCATTRTTAISYVIDGGGSAVGTGAVGQLDIPVACTVTGWVLTADQSGSAVVDVLRSTYANFPTTASIAGTDKPTLSTIQKNENLGPLTNWGSTALSAGDQLQFNVNSATTVTRLNLTLIVTVP